MAKTQKSNSKQQDCLFCKIIQGNSPSHRIYEDSQVLAFLDIYPQAEGHTLIVPKTHSINLLDTKEDLICQVMTVAKKLANQYQSILGAKGFVVKIHNGKIANQLIPHFHVHLIPVYTNQNKNTYSGKKSKKELETLAETITSQLD